MALVLVYLPQLTWLGISYFTLEALLVIGLATVEWTLPSYPTKQAKSHNDSSTPSTGRSRASMSDGSLRPPST